MESIFEQNEIDRLMLKLDGTDNKENLGANAILAVSLAVAKAAAEESGMPLWLYLTLYTHILIKLSLYAQ